MSRKRTPPAAAKYRDGDVYYEVTYRDPSMCYPIIQTYVLAGVTHVQEEHGREQVWCFQYVESFVEFGSVLEHEEGNRAVFLKTRDRLSEMLDQKALISELRAATRRRGARRSRRK